MMENNREKVLDAANTVERKAMNTVDNVEKSGLGQYIPLEITNLPLYDLTKYLMFFTIIDSIPVYIISGEHHSNKLADYFDMIWHWLFIFAAPLSAVLNLVTFYGKMFTLYKFVVPFVIIKFSIASVIMVIAGLARGWMDFLLSLMYVVKILAFELLFLYYLAILLRRIESDEYDNLGERLKDKTEEEEKV